MAQSPRSRSARRGEEGDGGPPREEEQEDRERTAPSEVEMQEGDRSGRLSAKELTEAALATIADLTGYEPESVAGLQWDGDSWLVTVDVLELARIPNTTDVLASYVVQLDDSGGLLGYKRSRRFVRGQVEGE
jgi:gas vesicle protein GvpO